MFFQQGDSEMSRKCFIIITLIVVLLISASGVVFSDRFSLIQGFRKPPGLLKKFYILRSHNHPDRYRMPVLRPDPKVDYKILTMKVDKSIDYKILDIAPREMVQGGPLKPRWKKFKLPGLNTQKLWHKPYDLKLKTSPLKTDILEKNQ